MAHLCHSTVGMRRAPACLPQNSPQIRSAKFGHCGEGRGQVGEAARDTRRAERGQAGLGRGWNTDPVLRADPNPCSLASQPQSRLLRFASAISLVQIQAAPYEWLGLTPRERGKNPYSLGELQLLPYLHWIQCRQLACLLQCRLELGCPRPGIKVLDLSEVIESNWSRYTFTYLRLQELQVSGSCLRKRDTLQYYFLSAELKLGECIL